MITLHNDGYSPITDKRWLIPTLTWLRQDLALKKPVRFLLQGLWTDLDKNGEPIPNTETPLQEMDGDAYSNGNVRVCIAKNIEMPFIWNVNETCGKGYVNDVIQIENAYELFLFLAAHELRHLWQWEQPKKAKMIRNLLKCTDETDADLYAIRKLSEYRKGKK